MNIDELEKLWAKRGFSFGVGTIKAGDSVDETVHDDKDEVVVMEPGEFEFIIGDDKYIDHGHREVLIPAGTRHTIKNIGQSDSKIYFGYKDI